MFRQYFYYFDIEFVNLLMYNNKTFIHNVLVSVSRFFILLKDFYMNMNYFKTRTILNLTFAMLLSISASLVFADNSKSIDPYAKDDSMVLPSLSSSDVESFKQGLIRELEQNHSVKSYPATDAGRRQFVADIMKPANRLNVLPKNRHVFQDYLNYFKDNDLFERYENKNVYSIPFMVELDNQLIVTNILIPTQNNRVNYLATAVRVDGKVYLMKNDMRTVSAKFNTLLENGYFRQ